MRRSPEADFCAKFCANSVEVVAPQPATSLFLHGCGMSKSRQELLKEAWLGGREGYISGQTQAKAWALREVWKDEHGEKI